MKQKNLYLMCGVSGAGKSTYVEQKVLNNKNTFCVSRDGVRFSLLSDEDDYFAKEDLVFEMFITLISDKLISKEVDNLYVDATHLTEKARCKVLDKLNLDNINIIPVVFTVSLETCLKQNAKRTGRKFVPESVIRNMYKNFKHPKFDTKYKYKEIIEIGKE